VRMMVGGTLAHNAIAVNLVAALHARLRNSGCRVFSSDVKVVSRSRSEATYPDVAVVCGDLALSDTKIEEPLLVAEILSRSTAYYDRGAKAQTYKRLPSLRYLLIVEQDRREVSFNRRSAAGWEEILLEGDATLDLPELGCSLPLDAVYEGVAV
jgi:Uma2 family endonuclease